MVFSEETCLEKKRVRSKMAPRKVGGDLKRRVELNKERWSCRKFDGDPPRKRRPQTCSVDSSEKKSSAWRGEKMDLTPESRVDEIE